MVALAATEAAERKVVVVEEKQVVEWVPGIREVCWAEAATAEVG